MDLSDFDVLVNNKRYKTFKRKSVQPTATGWFIYYRMRPTTVHFRKRNGSLFLRQSRQTPTIIHAERIKKEGWKCRCNEYRPVSAMICTECKQMKGE